MELQILFLFHLHDKKWCDLYSKGTRRALNEMTGDVRFPQENV